MISFPYYHSGLYIDCFNRKSNTPLVKNSQDAEYMNILLNGKSSLEELFAEIDVTEVLTDQTQPFVITLTALF